MEQSQTWAEALKINPKKLNEWSALAPDGMPVLVYILQEGHITPVQYLNWASAHYNLPVLGENYFEEAFDSERARNLQFALSQEWKPWMFPVEQWDGVTLVACMEPPTDPLGEEFRFVLVDPLVMLKTWSHMASSFTGTSIDASDTPESLQEIPSGMTSTSIKPFKLTLDDLNESNLFRSGLEPNEAPPVPADVEDSVVTETNAAHAAVTPPPPRKVAQVSEAPTFASPPVIKMPPLPKAAAPAADHNEEFEAPPISQMPTVPGAAPQPEPISQSVPSISLKPKLKPTKAKTKAPLLTTEQQDEHIELVFEQLKSVYRNVFIMKCQEGVARLYKWDESLKPAGGGKNIHVELAFPTFFRIISKTQLPYHGYLVDSPAHRDFFNGLKITDLPGCVTGIPIKDGPNLVGVLVGVGDDNLQKLDILRKAEAAADSLIDALAPSWGKAA